MALFDPARAMAPVDPTDPFTAVDQSIFDPNLRKPAPTMSKGASFAQSLLGAGLKFEPQNPVTLYKPTPVTKAISLVQGFLTGATTAKETAEAKAQREFQKSATEQQLKLSGERNQLERDQAAEQKKRYEEQRNDADFQAALKLQSDRGVPAEHYLSMIHGIRDGSVSEDEVKSFFGEIGPQLPDAIEARAYTLMHDPKNPLSRQDAIAEASRELSTKLATEKEILSYQLDSARMTNDVHQADLKFMLEHGMKREEADAKLRDASDSVRYGDSIILQTLTSLTRGTQAQPIDIAALLENQGTAADKQKVISQIPSMQKPEMQNALRMQLAKAMASRDTAQSIFEKMMQITGTPINYPKGTFNATPPPPPESPVPQEIPQGEAIPSQFGTAHPTVAGIGQAIKEGAQQFTNFGSSQFGPVQSPGADQGGPLSGSTLQRLRGAAPMQQLEYWTSLVNSHITESGLPTRNFTKATGVTPEQVKGVMSHVGNNVRAARMVILYNILLDQNPEAADHLRQSLTAANEPIAPEFVPTGR